MEAAYRRIPESAIHPTPFSLFLRLGRESRSLFGRGTTILCLFRSHLLFIISPPSLRGWLRIYIYNIYTYVYVYIRERLYVCMPPLCSSLSLAVSVGRAARTFHLSFSLFFSVLDVLLGLVPTILEYVRYARLRLCFVDRGHTGKRYKEKKGIFLMIL